MKSIDKKYYNKKIKLIAGVDEAGRGPLAGPVVAAAVIFNKRARLKGIKDSKLLSAKKREELFDKIVANALAYSVASVEQSVIDKINILNATFFAMKKAIDNLEIILGRGG